MLSIPRCLVPSLAVLATLAFLPSVATADEDADTWAGIWKTNFGTMLLYGTQGVYAGLVVGQRNTVVAGRPDDGKLALVLTAVGTGKRGQGSLGVAGNGLAGKWDDEDFTADRIAVLDAAEGGGDWAGPWKSTFGLVTLLQHGDHVFGAVASPARQGAFFGKLDGRTLAFVWYNNDGTHGNGSFTLDENGKAAEGTWGRDASATDGGIWRLRKMDPSERPR